MVNEFHGGWIANLSNGETVYETDPIPNDISSWRKLIGKCKDNNLKITSLKIRRGDVVLSALPQKQCEGYYHAYEATKSLFTGKESLKQGIGAVVGDKVYIIWISTEGEITQEIRSVEVSMPHIIL
jgi:hypothetical protein